jgi:acetylornithine deacetylase/succinyl-diaminopimelate desuccinylase-like protein
METERLVEDAIRICEVPAPTGDEGERGRVVASMLEACGARVETDSAGNVIGEIPGEPGLPCVALAAHLDTVFPDLDLIEVVTEDGWLHAPGIGDNSMGVAALVACARDLPRTGLGRILLAATVGEEGIGDLRGARHLVSERGGEIDAFLAVEGAMRDAVVTGGVGSERLEITVAGPGGHSWGDAGAPSALAGASALVLDLYDLALPEEPKTTVNVGTLTSGNSINSIAETAVLELDLRSLDQDVVADLRDRAVARILARFPGDGALTASFRRIGSRPAGRIAADHPLLDHVRAAREEAGLAVADEFASSTDANIPLHAGIPATCVGIGIGEDGHRRTERLRIDGLAEGYAAMLAAVRRIAADPALTRTPGAR